MNLNILEKVARQTTKGNATEKGSYTSPIEHRSLSSLSQQIAANMRANGNSSSTYAMVKPTPSTWW